MDIKTIVAELESERDRLEQALAALQKVPRRISRKASGGHYRQGPMSATRRKRIGEAMKKLWAARRKAEKTA